MPEIRAYASRSSGAPAKLLEAPTRVVPTSDIRRRWCPLCFATWRARLRPGLALLVLLLITSVVVGQRGHRWSRRGGFRDHVHRGGVPDWKNDSQFAQDIFTFARVRYGSWGGRGRWGRSWDTDWPDSDLNFSFRLHQLTSLHVDPEGSIVQLTDENLCDYPFLYLIEPGNLYFEEDEVAALRRYLLNGGFLMVDDFWGEREWYNFAEQMSRVFPDRKPQDLTLDHEIFHFVYDLKELPLIPSIHVFYSGYRTERPDAQEPHYRAIYDDDGRMMVFIGHNTDLGDGWEREGEDATYFREYSEKSAYPLGINVIVYAMTH